MGLRKFFGQNKKAAGGQKCSWSATLRQPRPVSNQNHQPYHLPLPPSPQPPPLPPPTVAETSSIIYTPPHRTRHNFYNSRRRMPIESEDQLPPFRYRRPMMQQYPAPPFIPATRARYSPRYRAQPANAHEPSYTYGFTSESPPPPYPNLTGPDVANAFALICKALISIFCFAIGISVTVACGAIWILAKISTSIETQGNVPPEAEGEYEVIPRRSRLRPADLPVESTYWRVMAWACEQSFRQLRSQDQAQQEDGGAEPESQRMAHGAAHEAWAKHAARP